MLAYMLAYMVPYEGVQIKFKLDFPLGNGAEFVYVCVQSPGRRVRRPALSSRAELER